MKYYFRLVFISIPTNAHTTSVKVIKECSVVLMPSSGSSQVSSAEVMNY